MMLSHAAKTSEQEAEKHVLQATRLRDDPRAYFKHGMGLSGLFPVVYTYIDNAIYRYDILRHDISCVC